MPSKTKQPKRGGGVSQEQYARIKAAVEEDRKQVELAKRRMGGTPAELLRWVVEFAQSDLDLLRPEERQAKGYDLRALPNLVRPRITHAPAKSGETRGGDYVVGPMSEEILRRIHAGIADGLRKLFTGRSWQLPGRKTYLYRSSPDEAPRTRFGLLRETEGEEDTILATVADLVLETGGKLRVCPECQKVFVANRRQRHCCAEHSQQARNQRKKERIA